MSDGERLIDVGLQAHQRNDLLGASGFYRRGLALAPGHAGGLHLIGLARHQLGDPLRAIAWLERARKPAPASATLLHNLGEALHAAKAYAGACRFYIAAISLENWRPESYLGLALSSLGAGHLDQARQAARGGLVAFPAEHRLWMALGLILQHLAEGDSVKDAFERALSIAPGDPEGLVNLGGLCLARGGLGAARRLLRRAVALAPESAAALANLGGSEISLAEPSRAAAILTRATTVRPHDAGLGSNLLFALNLDPASDNQRLFAAYRRWGRRYGGGVRQRDRPRQQEDLVERRLRVGYLSADLRAHPVAFNVLGLLENHDRQRIEAHCFAEVVVPDAVSRRFMAVSRWHSTVGLDDAALASLIAAERIDILVVLAGHTAGNRITVCALKPAPIQISFHDLSTSGMETVDAWFTDPILHPSDTTEGFTETLVRLPNFYLHQPPDPSPPVSARHPDTPPTFGSFSNPAKLNDEVLDLWSGIVGDVRGAKLILGYGDAASDEAVRERVTKRFVSRGVGGEQLVFLGREPARTRHLERVGAIDVALDPFPFAGSTATFEALWMGVPVVTLAGSRFLGRVGASLLEPLGMADLVARSKEEYATTAKKLIGDEQRLKALRATLRSSLAASAICDGRAYAQNVEAQYLGLWRAWCGPQQ